MGRFDGVLLASDFDNTLIYTEEACAPACRVPPLSLCNREALEWFMAEGGRFAVATGRALAAFVNYADGVPMNAPAVVCNGAAIYDFQKKEYLDYALLDEDAAAVARSFWTASHPWLWRLPHRQCDPRGAAQPYHPPARAPDESGGDGGPLLAGGAHAPGQAAVRGGARRAAGGPGPLIQEGWDRDYELIFSGKTLLEMTAKGANKGGMVLRLAARLGIGADHVYCAGDEANDIPMLTAAARLCPANCVEAVRQCGATVVCDAREGALADVVEILEKQYT